MKKTCIILVGLPGTGKSTFTSKFDDEGFTVLSSDNLIDKYAASVDKSYDEIFLEYAATAEHLFFEELKQAVREKKDIIVDRTNMSVKSRKRIIDLVDPNNYTIIAYYFPKPAKEEYQRRLNSRVGKTIPEEVIDRMSSNFQMPKIQEGFDHIVTVVQ